MARASALLRQFLKANDISQAKAARELGVTNAAVIVWLRGDSVPMAENKLAIETWTKGAVPAASWPPAKRVKSRKPVVPFAAE